MKASEIELVIDTAIDSNRTICLEGPPGGGKTSMVHQGAKRKNKHYIEQHLPTMLVEDFGYPDPTKETIHYKLPDWYPAKGSKWDDGKGVVLCFDDRNQAGPDLQKVLANICQARTLHGVPLCDDVTVISTGNRVEDRAGSNRILGHLSNRENVFEYIPDWEETIMWMTRNGGNPKLMAFLSWKRDLVNKYDPNQRSNPTSRSWFEGVNPFIDKIHQSIELKWYAGAVGEGPAAMYMAFQQVWRELPDPAVIIKNPDTAMISEKPDVLYALCGSLAESAKDDTIEPIMRYAARIPVEFAAVLVRIVVTKNAKFYTARPVLDWGMKNKNIIIA